MSRARYQSRPITATARSTQYEMSRRKRREEGTARRCGGSGEPLVLLHPFGLCSEVWCPILPALKRQHEVFALSIPGHHGSDPLPDDHRHSIASTVDLLEAKLDAMGIKRAHLVGNSLGGWLAIELARRGRALSVVALAPGGGWEANSAEHKRLVRRFLFTRKVLELGGPRMVELSRWTLCRALLLRDAVAAPARLSVRDAMLLLDRTRSCAVYEEGVRALMSQELPEPFVKLPCPIRLVWGKEDRVLPLRGYSERYLRVLPGAEWIVLPGVGHVQMYDDPKAVADSILGLTLRADAEQRLAS